MFGFRGLVTILATFVTLPFCAAGAQFFSTTNGVWKLRPGTNEASAPVTAWRQLAFDASSWSNAPAPIYYSTATTEPPFYTGGTFNGTRITGMQNSYSTVFLRREFQVSNPTVVPQLDLNAACDDGFIAWVNGVEIVRYNVPSGERAYNTFAGNSISEPAPFNNFTYANPTMLVPGTNVIAVQVFNSTLDSSDLGFIASLSAPVDVTPPTVISVQPPAGAVIGELTEAEVTFSEAVTGLDAADLRINGQAATNVTSAGFAHIFRFPQPAVGAVSVTWATNHGIRDGSSNAFGGAGWSYTLDTNVPVPNVFISEFMAANNSVIADEDGAFSDWIELLNPRPTTVNLDGWFLTDQPGLLSKWRFPATNLPPGGRLLVWASGKNRAIPGAPLHANFSLNASGEYLALVKPDTVTVVSAFSPTFPAQIANTSYGYPSDTNAPAYLISPTPALANSLVLGAGKVGDTKFFPTRGFFTSPFGLAITSSTAGVVIRYTTNGSLPSATNGAIYSGPILIARTTVVRAAAFKNGFIPSNADTHSYFFLDDVIRQATNGTPSGWPTTQVNGQIFDYAMDQRVVENSDTNIGGAAQILAALLALPTASITIEPQDLFGASDGIYVNANQRGTNWERAANMEFLNDPLGDGFHAGCGLRIRGNFSRDGNNPKHSFRVFFRSTYGVSKLNYRLFANSKADEFDTFDIQTPQDFSWAYYGPEVCNYMRDTWSRDAQGAMGQPFARSRWTHLYLNGVYWGIYQIEERPEAAFGATYLGGSKDDFDCIKATGFDGGLEIEATDGFLTGPPGQPAAWERLFNGCRDHFNAPADAKYFALQGLMPDGLTRTNATNSVLLDPDNLADYMLLIMHSANTDMASSIWVSQRPNNFFSMRRRGDDRGFTWVAHDGETSLDYYPNSYDRTGPVVDPIRNELRYSNPEFFHNDLMPCLEYRTRFGDRAHRALYNGGALSPEACVARLNQREAELSLAIMAESARWGDAQSAASPYTRADWIAKVDDTRQWFTGRREFLIQQLRADGLYPAVEAPTLSPFGGEFASGATLLVSAPAGQVYFTADGPDPRATRGAIHSAAQLWINPLPLTHSTRIRARALSGTNWSALVEAEFHPAQDLSPLHLTEIMFHPPASGTNDGDGFEFVEIKNTGTLALDLGGLEFNGIDFAFSNNTILQPGAFLVLARNPTLFTMKYPGVSIRGVYPGSLDNNGETLTLLRPGGAEVFSITYNDRVPWPIIPDGEGFSLVPRAASAPPSGDGADWRASAFAGGSPGTDDPEPAHPRVFISEILSRPTNAPGEWIELFNAEASSTDVSGWWLSDDGGEPRKFRLPSGSIIPAGGFLTVNASQFSPPGLPTGFSLDDGGEQLYLASSSIASTNLTGWSHGVSFNRTPPGTSTLRVVTSDGREHWPTSATNTPAAANSPPRIGPVVINEVHYHPADGEFAFVELRNAGTNTAPLYDPDFPMNTWRVSGLDFYCPTGAVLLPGGFAVISEADPAVFRARYSVPAGVPVWGPFAGRLENNGETLELQQPDTPDTNGFNYITVDVVRYRDTAPWPALADGFGPALQRINPAGFGSEPTNWNAVGLSPGRSNILNLLPTVALTSPTNGAVLLPPATVTLHAAPADNDGSIVRVEFLVDGVKVGESTAPPWQFPWTNPPAGEHTLNALARDNQFGTTLSVPVMVTVVQSVATNESLVALTGGAWRYWDRGARPATNWFSAAYSHASWSNGPAQLGYGDTDEATIVSFGPNSAAKFITTYFRREVVVADLASISGANLRVIRDDGVAIYLNGAEIVRDNLPAGTLTSNTLANISIGPPDESTPLTFTVNPAMLAPGTNLIAAEIHQQAVDSSDISFALEFNVTRQLITPHITQQPASVVTNAGAVAQFQVNGGGSGPLSCQWHFNGQAIAGATNLTLGRLAVATNLGAYRAVLANAVGRATSAVATLTLAAEPPLVISISAPVSSNIVLRLLTRDGRSYEVQSSISASNWLPFTNLPGVEGIQTLPLPAGESRRFFRVRETIP